MADKALLCGINDYKAISGLKGCLADVQNLQELLTNTYGFEVQNIRILRNGEVTKSAIVQGFQWLASGSNHSDRLIFHFSGHGSFTKSRSSTKTIDEVICFYDMDWRNEDSFLRDSDLGELTRTIKSGARLTIILDSCHSGTGTKAFVQRFKNSAKSVSPKNTLLIVRDTARRATQDQPEELSDRMVEKIKQGNSAVLTMFRTNESFPVYARYIEPPASIRNLRNTISNARKADRFNSSELNHQLLAAAHESQPAADAFLDGKYRGVFTYNLCQVAQVNHTNSFEEIMRLTTERIKQQGFSQDPQLDGPFRHEALFGNVTQDSPLTNSSTPIPVASTPIIPACPELLGSNDQDKKTNDNDPLATISQFFRVTEKLVDLAVQTARAGHSSATGAANAIRVSDFVVDNNMLVKHSSRPQAREIIGIDDRKRVTDTLERPFCWVCQILASAPGESKRTVGTGAIISDRTVLTAAHNLYVNNRRARTFEIFLAVNGDRNAPPLKTHYATQAVHHPSYVNSIDNPQFDIAVIHLESALPDGIIRKCGVMPIALVEPTQWNGQLALVTGYPRDYPAHDRAKFPTPSLGVQAFQYYCISTITVSGGLFRYKLDTSVGQSGGPLLANGLVNGRSQLVCIGVHIQGDNIVNTSIPMNAAIHRWVRQNLSGFEEVA